MDIEGLPTGLAELLKHNESQVDSHAKALGTFSIRFLSLEHAIDRTIHELLELEPETGYAVTSSIFNVSTRLEILYRLASDLPVKRLHRTIVLKAVDDAIDLNSYRNWLFHSPWLFFGGGLSRFLGIPPIEDGEYIHTKRRMQKSGNLREWQQKDFKASEIMAQSDCCLKVTIRLNTVIQRLEIMRIAKKKAEDAE